MKTSYDIYLAAKGERRDSDMARELGVTTASIAGWKKTKHLSPYYTVKCAEMSGQDVKEALAIAAIESEHEEGKRSFLLKKLGGVAASVAISAVTLFLTLSPNDAIAKTTTEATKTLCIMSNKMRKLFNALKALVAPTFRATAS